MIISLVEAKNEGRTIAFFMIKIWRDFYEDKSENQCFERLTNNNLFLNFHL